MTSQSRCILKCDELGAYAHRFPHPQRRSRDFFKWVSILGSVQDLDPMRVYKSKRVCDFHFETQDKTSGHRLINSALPTLHLQGVFKNAGIQVQVEHNYCLPRIYFPLYERLPHHVEVDPLLVESSASSSGTTEKVANSRGAIKPRCSQGSIQKELRYQKKENRKLKGRLLKIKKREKTFKARLAEAEKVVLRKVTKRMLPSAKELFDIQYHQTHKRSKGRRFTVTQKILCLSLYKRSPRVYPLLSKYFILPSTKALRGLLAKITIKPGENKVIFERMKDSVADLPIEDRCCILAFDEMSITPQLNFETSIDQIKGFACHGEKLTFADHVLVFMVKGIKTNFKQPVAYYFTNSLKSSELKNYVKDIILRVKATGLRVLCTVCDQGSANVAAINSLIEETKAKYLIKQKEWRREIFEVQNFPIIPIYDVPHLLKGLRNNLLTKDLVYTDPLEKKDKRISWSYFQKLYNADKSYGELRCVPKLTEEHVMPEKIKKMRVKLASQLFSHSVAVATEHLTARKNLPLECKNLIPFVLLIDKLFDSLNANSFNILNGKVYRAAVKRDSPHHKLWQESILLLKSIKFINKKDVICSAPSVKNLIKTIESVRDLWSYLNIKYNIDSLLTRNLNQDPLENFFGAIRSLGVRNISPSYVAFEGAYKTLLINNLSSTHSIYANCEKDENVCLQNLHFYFDKQNEYTAQTASNTAERCQDITVNIDNLMNEFPVDNQTDEGSGQRQYVCGFVIKKCLNKIKGCSICRNNLLSTTPQGGSEFIKSKEYNPKKQWLIYPTKSAFDCFGEIQDVVTNYLNNLNPSNVKTNIKLQCDFFVNYKFSCQPHKKILKELFLTTTINILVHSWCKSVNRILSGKITYDGDDPLKISAQMYYNKHKKNACNS